MSEFTPEVGAWYSVRDPEGRTALLFVNGPTFKDSAGTRFVFCQTKDVRDARGRPLSTTVASLSVVVDALEWTPAPPPDQP